MTFCCHTIHHKERLAAHYGVVPEYIVFFAFVLCIRIAFLLLFNLCWITVRDSAMTYLTEYALSTVTAICLPGKPAEVHFLWRTRFYLIIFVPSFRDNSEPCLFSALLHKTLSIQWTSVSCWVTGHCYHSHILFFSVSKFEAEFSIYSPVSNSRPPLPIHERGHFVIIIWYNFSILSRKHEFSFCVLFSILPEMFVNYFKIIVSGEIDMDLFMKPGSKQAANILICHAVPHRHTI